MMEEKMKITKIKSEPRCPTCKVVMDFLGHIDLPLTPKDIEMGLSSKWDPTKARYRCPKCKDTFLVEGLEGK